MGKKADLRADDRWRKGTLNQEEVETLQRYGIDRKEYGYQKDDDEGSHLKGDYDDLRKELANRAMGDYDTRRTMGASAMAGNEKSKEFAENGFADAMDVVKGYDHMKSLKKEYVGGGGMRGAKNIAGLTHAMVELDRDNLNETLDNKYKREPVQDDLAKSETEQKTETVLSGHLARAKSIVDQYENTDTPLSTTDADEFYERKLAAYR